MDSSGRHALRGGERLSSVKAYDVKDIRAAHPNAYAPWTDEDDERLRAMYEAYRAGGPGVSHRAFVKSAAAAFKRNIGSIYARLGKLFGTGELRPPHPTRSVTKSRAAPAPTAASPGHEVELNDQFREALGFLEDTSAHVFVTGRAGTGKSTLVDYFRAATKKQIAVVAPTGVAALHVRGQTIHSFFRFGIDITPQRVQRSYGKRNLIFKNLETLVIDEVSMVRADLLDCVDRSLRLNRGNMHEPFGGVQMVFVGDLYQLPPVVPDGEEEIFSGHYVSPYFFDARVMQNLPLKAVELTAVYRQKDEAFIRLLNAVRDGEVNPEILAKINARCAERDTHAADFSVVLTTRTRLAEAINLEKLAALKTPAVSYEATVSGDCKTKHMPTAEVLQLKAGAQVMLLNNDSGKRWVNGTLGKIARIGKGTERDTLEVELQNGAAVDVTPHTWEMTQYYFDKKANAIETKPVGSFTQYPVKLAWAVTIHKAQGKTFDRVVIDIGEGTFAHGQMYVALSRCTTLEGITLRKPVQERHIFTDRRIAEFLSRHRSSVFGG